METTLIQLFTSFVGEIPPELESLVYIFMILVLLFVIDAFFMVLSSVFGVSKWKI